MKQCIKHIYINIIYGDKYKIVGSRDGMVFVDYYPKNYDIAACRMILGYKCK